MAKTATAPATKSQALSLDIAKSDETLDLAKDLAKFIKDNKLTTQVQGKEFVNVEGWQYAGSRLGIVPIVEHVINLSTEQELKYQAKVTLFDLRHQSTVGAGFAVCSNKEGGKKFYQEFAIASMAQTRAIGKAYRNILAWIIRAAGYEPTPAEEMEYSGNVPTPAVVPAVVAETVPMAVTGGGVSEAPAPVAAQYATASQKGEIIHLLNHPLITRQEKTKMLLNINRLDEERAGQAINKLTRTIADREGTTAVAEPAQPTAPAGNDPAGAPQDATPAGLPFADPAASTGAAESIDVNDGSWLPIPGYEGKYYASNRGEVYSATQQNGLLKLTQDSYGYPRVGLIDTSGTQKNFKVHRIVASLFVENSRPDFATQVNHINGIKSDNQAVNLEWVTPAENTQHAYNTGLASNAGEQNGRAKLTDAQANEIKGRLAAGEQGRALAAEFGVSETTISTIKSGKVWAQVEASDLSGAAEPAEAPEPGFSSPEVAAIAQQIEGFTSSMELKKFWDGLTGGQRKELLPVKDAKQKAILDTIHLAAATASRQNGGAMRPAGKDSALVDEFVNEPVVAGASFGPATEEQRNQLVSLLNDTRITFKEKAALLKAVPSLDTERACQALITVREAIGQREAAGLAAQVAALADRESGETQNEAGLQAA